MADINEKVKGQDKRSVGQSELMDGLDALVDLWQKRAKRAFENEKTHRKKEEFKEAIMAQSHAYAFLECAKNLKEKLGN